MEWGTFQSRIVTVEVKARPVVIKRLKKKLPSTAFIDDIGILVHNFPGSSARGLGKLKLKPILELM